MMYGLLFDGECVYEEGHSGPCSHREAFAPEAKENLP